MNTEEVVLVDEFDKVLGSMEKMEAHRLGKLHRAFSVFIFNSAGQLLLQQRALNKYHSAGLWTNTCCSHPRPGEDTKKAAERRLQEEMGFNTALQYKTSFTYKADFDNALTEHEFDHIFTGIYEKDPQLNKNEAESFRWMDLKDVKEEIKMHPEQFTVWFRIAMEELF